METISFRLRKLLALVCVALLAHGEVALLAQDASQQAPAEPVAEQVEKLPPDQLDSLVAPIALYPDPLLAQTLVAATYPLEIIQLQQWMAKHTNLKDKALADAVAKEPWDPASNRWRRSPRWSSGSRTTSSGRRSWGTHSSSSRAT